MKKKKKKVFRDPPKDQLLELMRDLKELGMSADFARYLLARGWTKL